MSLSFGKITANSIFSYVGSSGTQSQLIEKLSQHSSLKMETQLRCAIIILFQTSMLFLVLINNFICRQISFNRIFITDKTFLIFFLYFFGIGFTIIYEKIDYPLYCNSKFMVSSKKDNRLSQIKKFELHPNIPSLVHQITLKNLSFIFYSIESIIYSQLTYYITCFIINLKLLFLPHWLSYRFAVKSGYAH